VRVAIPDDPNPEDFVSRNVEVHASSRVREVPSHHLGFRPGAYLFGLSRLRTGVKAGEERVLAGQTLAIMGWQVVAVHGALGEDVRAEPLRFR